MLQRLRVLAVAAVVFALAPLARAQFDEEPTGPLTEAQFVERVLAKMKEHNYFSKVLVQVDRSQPPIVFFLHKPQVEQPGWDTRIVGTYAPWLKKTEELFRKTYVEPLAWKRRDDVPLYAVCELQTEGDYINFRKSQQEHSFNTSFASYDKKLRAVVAHPEQGKLSANDKRYFLMAEFVRVLVAAHFHGGHRPAQAWLLEGLGSYLCEHVADDPKTLDQRYIDPRDVEVLVQTSQDAALRDLYLLPLADLAATRGADQVWAWMNKRAAAAGVADLEAARQWRCFRAQSALWMHYLHDAESGRHRAALMKFLSSAMAGDGGVDALKRALAPLELADLDRELFRWIYARFEGANPGRKLERRLIDELFVARPAVVASTGAGAAPAAPASPAATAFSPGALIPPRSDVAAAHGAILQRARRGALESAKKELTELEARARSGPFGRRVASDLERVTRFIALRDAYLAELIAAGGKLEFELDGKKISAKPERIENGLVLLGENRAKLASVPLELLDTFEIARALPKKLSDGPDGWVRLWAYVLAGDQRWKTLLKGDSDEVTALRSDALEWYPPLLEIGAASQRLIELADAGVPADAVAATKCLDALRELRAQHGELQLVKERAAALAALAKLALEKQFDPASVAKGLHGVVEQLGDGVVRVTYEFDDEAQARDFVFDAAYESEWRQSNETVRPSAALTEFTVIAGAFRGTGSVCYRLPLALEAPLKVTARMQFSAAVVENEYAAAVRIGVGDDRKGNFVASEDMGGLRVIDRATGLIDSNFAPSGVMLDIAHTYELTLAVDGKRATTTLDGQKVKELPCGSRKRGDVFIAVFGNAALALHGFVVEGKLAVEETRANWVATRLVELGFSSN